MSRTGLYLLIGILVVALVGLGIYVYDQQSRSGLDVHVDGNGLSIQGN